MRMVKKPHTVKPDMNWTDACIDLAQLTYLVQE